MELQRGHQLVPLKVHWEPMLVPQKAPKVRRKERKTDQKGRALACAWDLRGPSMAQWSEWAREKEWGEYSEEESRHLLVRCSGYLPRGLA